ncbi:MAG: pentapeptide repeat-containing protein [Proteobacteria bacterium]|nr:pentapeptide repeat-containing protein [Pseudomonadota bacterium]
MGLSLNEFYDLIKKGMVFLKTDFSWAQLEGAALGYEVFINASFKNANLKNADFLLGGLINTDLSYADMEGARLIGAKLSGSNLYRANLNGAKYSSSTIWPDNFDPIAAGAVLDNEPPNSDPESILGFMNRGGYPKTHKDW